MNRLSIIRSLSVVFALLILAASPAMAQVPASFSQKLIVPAYFEPGEATDGWNGGAWAELAAAPEVGIIIVNPYNGPGSPAQVSVYRSAIEAARAAGKKVIGYVSTDYASRDFNAVKADIDNYFAWYTDGSGHSIIDGIFVDEAVMTAPEADPNTWLSQYTYYYQVHGAIKAHGAGQVAVLNAGTGEDHTITDVADVVINFESTAANFATSSPPSWQSDAAPGKCASLVYAAGGAAAMQQAVNRAKSLNMGWVYVTADGGANPWDTLPAATDWSQVRAAVANTAAQVVPTALTSASAANDSGEIVVEISHSFEVPSLTSKYRRVYLDTDKDALTGYALDGVGADYLVENSWAFSWDAANKTWSYVGYFPPEVDTVTATRWRLDRRDFGSVDGPVSVKVVLDEANAWPSRKRYSAQFNLGADSLAGMPCTASNDAANITYSLTMAGTYSYRHVFIDTDESTGTGYWFNGVGADYMIENGHLYRHNGSGWSWTWVAWLGMSCSGDTCTWTVPRATVGETAATGEASDLSFHASGSSPTYYGPAFTHQFSE